VKGSKRVRVLQLISSGGFYGAENMLLNLAASQKRMGLCEPRLLLFYNVNQPNEELYRRAMSLGLDVRMLRCEGRADLRAIKEIREYIRTEKIDLIHTHGYKADLYGYLAARTESKPIVATCHNWVGGTAALGIYNRLDRMALRNFSGVAAVSEAVAKQLQEAGIESNKIHAIANGIDIAKFFGAQAVTLGATVGEPVKTILIVARLDLQKGFKYLLEAFSELTSAHPDVRLVIVGEGPDQAAIEALIASLNLKSRIVLAGERGDMPNVYASCDIFVLPSLNEGLPMTVLEAMAAMRPVVASNVGAIPTVIKSGETGLLVEPRDVTGLKSALDLLLSDRALCGRLAIKGHEWVRKNFTSDAMAANYQGMYEKVLTGKTGSLANENPTDQEVNEFLVKTGSV
jgi:glycosyltransferase involved in cell wall biosynthesis